MADPSSPHAHLHPVRMGLEPLPLTDWLAPRPDDAALLRERTRLIAAHAADVIAALPEADAAIGELADLLRARGRALETAPDTLQTLAAIGRCVAEDLCVLTATKDGYRLTAGVLCFPNRWRLVEKIGGSLLAVHKPVPDYADQLAESVDRFLAKLRPDRAFIRSNWGLANTPERFLPNPTPPINPRTDAVVFLRREDQSFLKLPRTGAVIFAIRTTITPWSDVPAQDRTGILEVIDGLSPEWLSYKSIG